MVRSSDIQKFNINSPIALGSNSPVHLSMNYLLFYCSKKLAESRSVRLHKIILAKEFVSGMLVLIRFDKTLLAARTTLDRYNFTSYKNIMTSMNHGIFRDAPLDFKGGGGAGSFCKKKT